MKLLSVRTLNWLEIEVIDCRIQIRIDYISHMAKMLIFTMENMFFIGGNKWKDI